MEAVEYSCMVTDRSTEGMPAYPKAAPPLRLVRVEGLQDLFQAVKGAFHDLVSSSCTSRKNGNGEGQETIHPPSKDQDTVEDST